MSNIKIKSHEKELSASQLFQENWNDHVSSIFFIMHLAFGRAS